jgi:3-phenylpropionate/trans-cinnamate dioxygenase ferredoxin component
VSTVTDQTDQTDQSNGLGLAPVEGRTWWRACGLDQLLEDEGLVLCTLPRTSLFSSDGEVFCIDDTCTHEDYSLAEGWVEGCVVECTLHMAKFSLKTGASLSPPATRSVATHPVAPVGDDVYVALPVNYVVRVVGNGLA